MVWGKRRFAGIEYVPSFDLLEKLLMANAALYREFIMVSTKTSKPSVDDFYLGVPNKTFFPKRIDTCTLPTPRRINSNLVSILRIGDESDSNEDGFCSWGWRLALM